MNSKSWRYTAEDLPQLSPFGSVLADRIAISRFEDGGWKSGGLIPMNDFRLHPGAHCLHYGSSCFEGLKAYRWDDDSIALFRPDRHIQRMQQSAAVLRLPIPDRDELMEMLVATVMDAMADIPPAPGTLYLRPILLGTDTNIGAAARPSESAVLYVMASPVGDYFAAGDRALRLLIQESARTTSQFGKVKTGANYASALGITLDARDKWGTDQILFCPDSDVQETGASNFVLIDDKTIITKPLCDSFLHGVTRDSVLQIGRDLGYEIQEKDFCVDDLLKWTQHGEAALSGTAAVLAGVGTMIHNEKEYTLSGGETGPNTQRLRKALVSVQRGTEANGHGWIKKLT
ncbi:branched-chain-amino-acid transaminase [Planctomycetes bacterium K23_9]|uniref:Branched-chain-amino-acid aminotransferase 2 n=1 Tax=Stieleria marina TaxID=1930275 RepID=A0A517NXB0_9BACT|nr:Branched-chain-amino-acid aminotransferase 2 [Planctomycetes bacterium K23_9]